MAGMQAMFCGEYGTTRRPAMDQTSTIDLLTRLNNLARDGDLTGRRDLMDEVAELRHFAQYQCKMDREDEYGHAFATAAQAWFLVSGTGLPAFEDTTYARVIEHSELAISALTAASSNAIH
jgi:hypothetical protein